MKAKTVFFCTECGSESPKWSGRCTVCGAWNSMVEQAAERPAKNGKISRPKAPVKASRITEMQTDEEIRFSTGMGELDRVLGGGAVKGSLVLVGGAPGSVDFDHWGIAVVGPHAQVRDGQVIQPNMMLGEDGKEVRR